MGYLRCSLEVSRSNYNHGIVNRRLVLVFDLEYDVEITVRLAALRVIRILSKEFLTRLDADKLHLVDMPSIFGTGIKPELLDLVPSIIRRHCFFRRKRIVVQTTLANPPPLIWPFFVCADKHTPLRFRLRNHNLLNTLCFLFLSCSFRHLNHLSLANKKARLSVFGLRGAPSHALLKALDSPLNYMARRHPKLKGYRPASHVSAF